MSIQVSKSHAGEPFEVSWFDKDYFRHSRQFFTLEDAESYAAKLQCRKEIEALLFELEFFKDIGSNAILQEPRAPSEKKSASTIPSARNSTW